MDYIKSSDRLLMPYGDLLEGFFYPTFTLMVDEYFPAQLNKNISLPHNALKINHKYEGGIEKICIENHQLASGLGVVLDCIDS